MTRILLVVVCLLTGAVWLVTTEMATAQETMAASQDTAPAAPLPKLPTLSDGVTAGVDVQVIADPDDAEPAGVRTQ